MLNNYSQKVILEPRKSYLSSSFPPAHPPQNKNSIKRNRKIFCSEFTYHFVLWRKKNKSNNLLGCHKNTQTYTLTQPFAHSAHPAFLISYFNVSHLKACMISTVFFLLLFHHDKLKLMWFTHDVMGQNTLEIIFATSCIFSIIPLSRKFSFQAIIYL